MSYITLAEVKNYLLISSNNEDDRLSNLINYACTLVETYCSREFSSANVIEYVDGGHISVFAKRIPINSVNSVSEYSGSSYTILTGPNADGSLPDNLSSNSSAMEFMWWADSGQFQRLDANKSHHLKLSVTPLKTFSNYAHGVKLDYNGGYDVVPGDIKLVTLDYLKILHKQLGGQSFSFSGENQEQYPLSANFPPHIRRILELYRLPW